MSHLYDVEIYFKFNAAPDFRFKMIGDNNVIVMRGDKIVFIPLDISTTELQSRVNMINSQIVELMSKIDLKKLNGG